MADIIDLAQEQEAADTALALQLHSQRALSAKRPKAAGHCLNQECSEPFGTDTERLFCGPSCAERYELMQRIKLH